MNCFFHRSGGYLSYSEETSCELICSAFILHNICKDFQIPLVEEDERFSELINEDVEHLLNIPNGGGFARNKRDEVAYQIYNGRVPGFGV